METTDGFNLSNRSRDRIDEGWSQGCNRAVSYRADAQARHGRVVFKLISTWHDRVSCLISSRHDTERCVLSEMLTRHEADTKQGTTRRAPQILKHDTTR
jgi:hypothetical protein